jgi:hypothetical protein
MGEKWYRLAKVTPKRLTAHDLLSLFQSCDFECDEETLKRLTPAMQACFVEIPDEEDNSFS